MDAASKETPVLLPHLGASGEEVRISCWLVDPGDSVERGDRLIEVGIRGFTFDVSAPAAGTLTRIEKPLNAVVATGDVLGWIREAGGGENSSDDSTTQPDAGE